MLERLMKYGRIRTVPVNASVAQMEATFSACALIVALIVTAITVYGVIKAYCPIPYYDQWGEVTVQQHLDRLLSQHNQHKILFPRLIFIADKLLFAGTDEFNLTLILLIQFVHAWLLISLLSRTRKMSEVEIASGGAIALSLLFWMYQGENFTSGFQVQFVGVFAAATGAFMALALTSGLRGAAASVILGGIAAFTMANGTLVPLLLVSLAVWLRRPRGQVLFLIIMAGLVMALFFYRYQVKVQDVPLSMLFTRAAPYALAYIGMPFATRVDLTLGQLGNAQALLFPARLFGMFGVAIFISSVGVLVWRPHLASPARLALLHAMAFIIATALMTEFGRINPYASRYGTAALVFWAAAILLLWSFRPRQSRRWALASSVTALTIAVIIATAQEPFINSAHEASLGRQQATTALLSHVVDNEAFERIFPWAGNVARSDVAAFLLAQAKEMRAEGLSIFGKRWANWLGTPLNTHADIISNRRCVGSLDEISIPTQYNPMSRVRGWAWDRTAGTVPSVILLTDTSGIVVGYALPGSERPDVKTAHPQLNGRTGWEGHASGQDLKISAYALLRSEREACLLPSTFR
jgi:hypothetical protein